MSFVFSSTCFAATQNVNVSTTPPGYSGSEVIQPDSVYPPDSYVNLIDNGRMEFSGSADGSDLYLNKGFKGVTSISYSVTNNYTSSLKIKIYKVNLIGTSTVDSFTVPAGCTLTGNNNNLSSSSKYYFAFEAPSNFYGYVEAN